MVKIAAGLVFIISLVLALGSEARPDTINLKNGRSIEGLIDKEDEENVVLDVGFGTVKFRKEEIKSIDRSADDEAELIRREWQEERHLEEKKRSEREKQSELEKQEKEFKPKEVGFSHDNRGYITVSALLNKKVDASLLLDTGASTVLLSNRIAKKLGKKIMDKGEPVRVQVADGRQVEAKYIVLDSLSVQGVEAKDVGAVVLAEDSDMDLEDGLLGMSFLSRFNFQIDTVNKKLILRRERQSEK